MIDQNSVHFGRIGAFLAWARMIDEEKIVTPAKCNHDAMAKNSVFIQDQAKNATIRLKRMLF